MRTRTTSPVLGTAGTLAVICTLWVAQLYAADGQPASRTRPATPQAGASQDSRSASSGSGDREHRRLDALAGRWTVRQTMWADPAKPPAIDRGTATFTAILGNHVRQDLRIDSAQPFEGLGYVGYDAASGRYDSLWMDVNFSGMILAHGGYDPASRTYTFIGAVPDPAHAGAVSPLREVMHVQDADHFTYEYYERHAGREALAVRLEYTRVK